MPRPVSCCARYAAFVSVMWPSKSSVPTDRISARMSALPPVVRRSPRTAQIVASGARFAAALLGRAGGPQARLLAGACDKGPARYGESSQYVVLAWVMRPTLQYMVSQVL